MKQESLILKVLNKRKNLMLGLVLILCAGFPLFGKGSRDMNNERLVYKDNTMKAENAFYSVDIQLPKTFVSKQAEKKIKAYAGSRLGDFRDYRKGGELFHKWEYSLLVSEKSSGALISYIAEGWSFTGGAHPEPLYHVFHYSAEDGRALTLQDVSIDESVYSELSRMVKKDPSVEIARGWEEGVSPNPANWENWYVEGENMVFVFVPYQIGPYSGGFSKWFLPLHGTALFKTSELLP